MLRRVRNTSEPDASRGPYPIYLDQQRVGHFIVAFAWGLRPRLDTPRWLNELLGRDANGMDENGGWMGRVDEAGWMRVGVQGPGVAFGSPRLAALHPRLN